MELRKRLVLSNAPARPSRGLCETCSHVADCDWGARSLTAIWQCDDFDPGPVRERSGARDGSRTVTAAAPDRLGVGLCANCEGSSGCTLPGRGTGIFFCEEYR